MKKTNIIELFAGVGGFRLGFENINKSTKENIFNIVWSNQFEPSTKKQHASEVYENKFGKVGHTNIDIIKVNTNNIPKHDILCGGFPCFVKGTKILTLTGYKKIEDILEGDYVLTHKNRWRKVISPMNQIVNHTFNLKIYGSPILTTTGNHPFYAIERTYKHKNSYKNGKRKQQRIYSYSNPKWVEAKNLKSTKNNKKVHFIGININKNRISLKKREGIPLEKMEFYWFLGRYLADGWYQDGIRKNSKVHKVILCSSYKEQESVEQKLSKLGLHYTISKERTVIKYIYSNEKLMKFIKIFGRYDSDKYIPKSIQDLPIKLLKHFIEGYRSVDGCISKKENNLHKITTISENIAYSFQNIIHKVYKLPCRIVFSKRPSTTIIEGRLVNQKDIYIISYRPFETREKTLYRDDKIWVPVKKNEEIFNKNIEVFNIEVEEDNSYTAHNYIVHNCQSYSVARPSRLSLGIEDPTKGVLWWEIIRIAKEHKTNYLMLENVDRLLLSPSSQKGKDFSIIIKSLQDLDYIVEWQVINAAEYGYPQKRRRTYIYAYKKDSKIGKQIFKNILKSNNISNILELINNKKTIFSETFPIKNIEKNNIKTYKLEGEIYDLSENFNKNNIDKNPFLSNGIVVNNIVYTYKGIVDDTNIVKQNLEDIILDDKDIEEEFFVTDNNELEKWKDKKGAKSVPRVNKKTGIEYLYKQGAMAFPESIKGPGRTIITSEGGRTASRTTHIIKPNDKFRRLHPIELERMNGFPDNHTKMNGVTNAKRGFLMGNALIVGIIEQLARTIKRKLYE